MSEAGSSGGKIVAWGVVGVVLLLALYVLSVGPASVLLYATGAIGVEWLVDAFRVFYWPLEFAVENNETAQELFYQYARWWSRILGVGPFA